MVEFGVAKRRLNIFNLFKRCFCMLKKNFFFIMKISTVEKFHFYFVKFSDIENVILENYWMLKIVIFVLINLEIFVLF
jgi:hypothetical protein